MEVVVYPSKKYFIIGILKNSQQMIIIKTDQHSSLFYFLTHLIALHCTSSAVPFSCWNILSGISEIEIAKNIVTISDILSTYKSVLCDFITISFSAFSSCLFHFKHSLYEENSKVKFGSYLNLGLSKENKTKRLCI